MPLLYLEGDGNERARDSISNDMNALLKNFHDGEEESRILLPSNRMKPLDIVKVLMGINSQREAVKRYQNSHQLWAKCHEYDYEQMLKLSTQVTQDFYCNALASRAMKGKIEAEEQLKNITEQMGNLKNKKKLKLEDKSDGDE